MGCFRWATSVFVSLATFGVLSVHPAAGDPGGSAGSRVAPRISAGPATLGARLWVRRYNGSGNDYDVANALGVSPDGSTVFVTGESIASTDFPDYATVAYGASTGSRLWVSRYKGPGSSDVADALGVAPDGSTVFVTGYSNGSGGFPDYATVAYDASTGTQLWVSRYNGAINGFDYAHALGVSPDGSKVFVTGQVQRSGGHFDYATVAYDASTGTQLWVSQYGKQDNVANALGVSPDGSTVFVTGWSQKSIGVVDYATVAYDPSTGTQLWVRRYNGPGNSTDLASALGVSPDGSKVFVTGYSWGSTGSADYATVAYDASTGASLWVRRYNGPGNATDGATALGVTPDGSAVLVTGSSTGSTSSKDFATVAYNSSNGASLWVRRYNGPGNGDDQANAVGVSPDGSKVFVTGQSPGTTSFNDYATVAYDASTGASLWVRRYNGPGNGDDFANALGVSPDGSAVFVTGDSEGSTSFSDYATVAYSAI